MSKQPNRTHPEQILIRSTREQQAEWELQRREFEALLYPNGEGHLTMQEFIRRKLDAAAELELRKAKK